MKMFRCSLAAALATAATMAWLEAASHTIQQNGKMFTPATVTVAVGDSVTFQNDDDVTHNAFSTSKGNEFNSKAQQPRQSSTVTFKTAGTVDVRCAFHPKMKMTVTVK
jgi:plastocyanin